MLRAAKRYARTLEQRYLLSRGVHHLRTELANGHVSGDAIAEIWLGWGNTGFSCAPPALVELCRLAEEIGDRTVLELGGGVSSLVLAILRERWPLKVVTIEHDEGWCAELRRRLMAFGLSTPDVRYAKLVSSGDFDWYDPAVLPDADSVGLVFCDGPPGSTRGGRSGALSLLAPHLSSEVKVLIDDTNRPAEDELSVRWAERSGLERTRYILGRDRAFDVLTLRGRT